VKREAWNKGKTGIYSEETRKRWSDKRKGKKLSKEQIEKMLETRKITNQKKVEELWNRKCYNDPSHRPFIHKSTGNPTWFKHPDIEGEFLCGNCNYHRKKELKFSSKEERYKMQARFMKNNNPMKNEKAKKKLSEARTGVPLGPIHTEEFKKKQGLRWTGKGNPNHGGLSPERRKALSKIKKEMFATGKLKPAIQKKGKDNPRYGIARSESIRQKISKELLGRKRSPETIKKIKAARARQINFGQRGGENEWELQIEIILNELGLEEKKDYQRNVGGRKGTPDFFVEKANLIIFSDGDSTHANPEKHRGIRGLKTYPGYKPDEIVYPEGILASEIRKRDKKIRDDLRKQGFNVIRFWISDIQWNKEYVITEIIKSLKNADYRLGDREK
tara:strand:+ start:157 stop:1320 length:1164 start_codon:yes stop_codon:yes gene_type:complete